MSAPQLMRIFKQAAGVTLVACLNHVRLTNGARLLRETDQSIAEIANVVGFAETPYRRGRRLGGEFCPRV